MKKRILILILSLLAGFFSASAVDCTITGPAATTTICAGETVSLIVSASGGTGGYTYQWYSNTTNSNTGGTSLGSGDGAQTDTYSPNTSAAGTFYYYCVITSVSADCGPNPSSVATVTVNPLPAAITGTAEVCVGSTTTLADATGGGTWSSLDDLIATVGSGTGIVTGVSGGVVDIKYTITATGCFVTQSVTVDPASVGGDVTGDAAVCSGTNSTVLTLSGHTGSVEKWQYSTDNWTTPIDISNTNLTYTATNLTLTTKYRAVVKSGVCSSATSTDAEVTVNPLPDPITGTAEVCVGSTTTLSNATGGGEWASLNTGVATVGSATGVVTGVSGGTADIKYTITATGCYVTQTVTVYAASVGGDVTGDASVCSGTNSTVLTLSGHTGTVEKWQYSTNNWGSSTDIANTATTYTAMNLTVSTKYRAVVSNGICVSATSSDAEVTVNPLPAAITGTAEVCTGSTTTLSNATGGGEWTSLNTGVATVGSATGVVTGVSGGTADIKYTITATGCFVTRTVTVYALPAVTNSPTKSICTGTSTSISLTATAPSSFVWTIGTITGGIIGAGDGSGPNISQTLDNPSTISSGTVEYLVVPTSTTGSCVGPSYTITVTVVPKPSPTNVQIAGTLKKGQTINTTYSYVPGVCFPEVLAQSEIRWYRNTVASGTGSMITMKFATDKTYTLVNDDKNMYIRVGVKLSDGSSLRDEVFSSWVGPVGDNAPEATNVNVVGNVRSGLTVYGTYTYVDAENDPQGASILKWYRADNSAGTTNKTEISTGQSYLIDHSLINKYIGFEVTPVATNGTSPGTAEITDPFVGPVVNSAPTAASVSVFGPLESGKVLNGLYTYSDTENDLEGSSTYKWYWSSTLTGTYTLEPSSTGISRALSLADQGKFFKFSVTPAAATGTSPGAETSHTTGYGPVNSKPEATGVSISGTVEVGQLLTGAYSVSDPDGDAPLSATFRWLRTGGLPISGATASTYTLTADDEGYTITFEVTPHSTGGYPTTGDVVLSAPTVTVPISPTTPKPVATDVCIQGRRAAGQTLTGRYTYSFTRDEGASEYKWRLGGVAIPGATGKTYVLTAGDISSNQNITFEVTPKSVSTVKTGTTVTSAPLARITLTQTTYTETVESVNLTADPAGGIFSGPYVTNGIFSPKDAGVGTPFTINHLYTINNVSNTCSQEESKDLTVIDASTAFGSVKTVYCRDDAPDLITVDNLPAGAYPYPTEPFYGFIINSAVPTPPAIVPGTEILTPNPFSGSTPWSVMINPALLNVGNNTLYLYYYDALGYLYQLRATLYVEQVGTITEISNLRTAYCAEDPQQNIQVYGLYPSGGNATWTAPGTLLTDKDQLIAKVNPGNISPGGPYTVTYQYTTPNGCKSNILTKNVTINPMPDASFNLNPSYNVEGDPFTLVPSIPYGGVFLGDGISGNTLFPNLAGTGPKNIVYKITDINGCIDEVPKSTVIRKAMGTINGLAAVECYSNTTKNITVTGLPVPPDVVNIVNFTNKKNSLVWSPGTTNALYNIAAARAGYDTLTFSYTWDGVPYSIKHGVYIDSIGNIEITGLKDNYCDYEGTATLRVLVENSTGSGNFSFSGPGAAFSNYGLLADFYPSLAPPSATPYTVSYTHISTVNSSGCTRVATLPVTVNKSPDVSIINSRITVNIKETPLVLNGLPAEGVFSGKGVYKSESDFVFDPEVAGLGDVEFALTYTDNKNCTTVKKDTFIVSAASGSILGLNLNNQYCYDGLKDTLTYSSSKPWYNGSFTGAGITDLGSAKAQFDPAAAGKGDHEIVFTYYDQYNTQFDVSAIVNVDSLGVVEIKPIAAGEEYCENDTPIELITTPRGGTFTGPVTTGYFTPSKALGDTAITYTYLNVRTGCSITGRIPFTIHPAPVVSFMPTDICIENKYDSIRFINNTVSSDAVSTWLWSFSDIGGTEFSSRQTPAYLFKSGGQHLITLTATTVNSCVVKKDLTFDLGVKPEADILWKNECFIAGDSIFIYDNTVSTSEIKSRTWNFFDGKPLKTGTSVYYPKNAVGPISVEYIVQTNYANCSDTVTRNIQIRPNIILTPDGYFENFEAGSAGWSKDDEEPNRWTFGTPDRTAIKSALSGTAAWFTRIDTLLTEHSSVISPCFDFKNIERPMISIGLRRNFYKGSDGAALQYRIGDSGTWSYVGTLDDGINWYNSVLINGKPGGEKLGWTSDVPDSKWIEASHTLDTLKGKKDVKFRLAYGSDGLTGYNDGIAFDDIFIGERKRTVLLEHFANTSSSTSSEATAIINQIDLAIDKDIANIQYHTNFPGVDSFYISNPEDASARILFYGLSKVPYSFVDGGTNDDFAKIFDYSSTTGGALTTINKNDIIRRGLISPVFDIELDSLIVSGGVLTINGKITSQAVDTISNLTLYIAVIEKINTSQTGAAGETIFRNVFRKFIPDAAGIVLPGIWSDGMTYEIKDLSWIIQKTLNSSDIEVVAFLQNNVTKEVYQAASMLKPKITVGIEKPGVLDNIDFALYPNPAKQQLTIQFGEPLEKNTDIFIYDFGGMVIKTFKAGSGETEFVIDDLGLKDGIYLIRVSSGGVNYGFKKLIISGS